MEEEGRGGGRAEEMVRVPMSQKRTGVVDERLSRGTTILGPWRVTFTEKMIKEKKRKYKIQFIKIVSDWLLWFVVVCYGLLLWFVVVVIGLLWIPSTTLSEFTRVWLRVSLVSSVSDCIYA